MTEIENETPLPPADGRGSADASRSLRLSPLRTLSPHHRRFVYGLIVMGVVAAVWASEFDRREQEVLNLVYEIRAAGGQVFLKSSLYDRLTASWRNQFAPDVTMVGLTGDTIDGHWLQQHDDLNTLDIGSLYIEKSALAGTDVARLVEQHPLRFLSGGNIRDSDAIAQALSANESLRRVVFYNGDLTDSGLRMLPLERLESVGVFGTTVTSSGLTELHRCRRLENVRLDGRQFDDAVACLLREQKQLSSLYLIGQDVTDDHLARIQSMTVRSISLIETSATPQGIARLQKSLPECRIHVFNDPDPPGDEQPSE